MTWLHTLVDGISWQQWSWHTVGVLDFIAALLATFHILLTKRNVQARAGWVALVWLTPLIGVVLYLLLGVNRIRRRAVALYRRTVRPGEIPPLPAVVPVHGDLPDSARTISRVIDQVTPLPLLAGNKITVLDDGRNACEAMLAAIETAQRSITLCTYIFDSDAVGERFINALAAAHARGVEVRVLIDAVGLRYSWFDPVDKRLVAAGVRAERFLPPRFWPWHLPYANLRNHRKILVIDGSTGFTGGMNIRGGYLLPATDPDAILDLHFRLDGPVVNHLQRSFQEDWLFVTGEVLAGDTWFPDIAQDGDTLARGISDGPDEDFDRLLWAYLAGIQGAQQSIHIVTPYFLPEPELVSALNGAAMRGVEVTIVLPEQSDLALVDWAASGILDELLAHGCRVFFAPAPFDHAKLFLADDASALIGSGNWDPRSLKLNFEFVVECHDPVLGRRLRYVVAGRLARARAVTLAELRQRPLLTRLRDGLAGLLTPYL